MNIDDIRPDEHDFEANVLKTLASSVTNAVEGLEKINKGKDFSNQDFSGQDLSGMSFIKCKLIKCTFNNCNMENMKVSGSNLFMSTIGGKTSLKDSDFNDCTFNKVLFKGALMKGTRYVASDFLGAKFIKVTRTDHCEFVDCNLSTTDFKGSNFNKNNFSGSSNPDIDFSTQSLESSSVKVEETVSADASSLGKPMGALAKLALKDMKNIHAELSHLEEISNQLKSGDDLQQVIKNYMSKPIISLSNLESTLTQLRSFQSKLFKIFKESSDSSTKSAKDFKILS